MKSTIKLFIKTFFVVISFSLLAAGCVVHVKSNETSGSKKADKTKINTKGSAKGSIKGSAKGSAKGSIKGSAKGSIKFSKKPSKGMGKVKNKSDDVASRNDDSSKHVKKDPSKDYNRMNNNNNDMHRIGGGKIHSKNKDDISIMHSTPSEPSDNDFGYTDPVSGCFKGEVMFIEPNSTKLPEDYSKYDVAATVYACEWDIPKRSFEQGFPGIQNKVEWFAIRYTGAFQVSEAGTYTFRINSDDGTKLYIDGKLVVDNDGAHPPKSKSGTIELTAGNHDLVLEYFQGPRYLIALQVYATPPNGEEGIFSVRD